MIQWKESMEFESNKNVIFVFEKNKIRELLDAYGKCILDTSQMKNLLNTNKMDVLK